MLVNREWQDEPELFEEVAMALEESMPDAQSFNEEGAYGERGYIVIRHNGKKYRLSLQKEV